MQIRDTGLLEAISAEHPCGESLEDTQLLASFDGYGLFGRSAPLSAEIDWHDIRDRSLEAMQKSKDFRLLTHLASAVVRTDGFAEFVQTLTVGARWLDSWVETVFPLVDEDGILRRSALNGFADRMAVVDGVRRAPILVHRQLGSVSMRDIEIVTGHLIPAEGETGAVSAEQLEGLFAATSVEQLRALHAQLNEAVTSLKSMETAVSLRSGVQAAPDFATLAVPLARTLKRVSDHLATRPDAAAEATPGATTAGGAEAAADVVAVGTVRNRQDATRALDAVAAFFRTNEPSSPIPLLIERAKRLVAKDFLEVLAELAPEALGPAKAASGVRDSDDT
ncbi:MAG TPA: type VI secretion system protein TssA [Steroidobacteraceae bacterium]|nr:type VI secretion system protein TssA [Steroidobacteraceae bacterium]